MSENFKQIQRQLQVVLDEPVAPAKLVSQTRRCCEAVVWARESEEQLARQGASLSKEGICRLAAISALGQLALEKRLPDGPPLPALAQQLAAEPRFQRQLGGTAHDVLHALRSGALLRRMAETAQPAPARQPGCETRDKRGPAR